MERILQPKVSEGLLVVKVWFQEDYIFIRLADQWVFDHPLSWYPHLAKGTPAQREKVEFWNEGAWLHWEDLDEDLSVQGFLSFTKPGK
jgi:hypothetical protein